MKKKKVVAPEAEAPKEFLNEEIKPNTIKAKFNLQQLIMKELSWKMKIKVEDILPRTYYKYAMAMVFDETPYERKIAGLQDDIRDIQDSRQKPLFESENQDKITELEEEVEEEKRQMEEHRKECKTIKMPATVEELKYSGTDTLLTFKIPDTSINELNENKLKFGYYIIELTPEF